MGTFQGRTTIRSECKGLLYSTSDLRFSFVCENLQDPKSGRCEAINGWRFSGGERCSIIRFNADFTLGHDVVESKSSHHKLDAYSLCSNATTEMRYNCIACDFGFLSISNTY